MKLYSISETRPRSKKEKAWAHSTLYPKCGADSFAIKFGQTYITHKCKNGHIRKQTRYKDAPRTPDNMVEPENKNLTWQQIIDTLNTNKCKNNKSLAKLLEISTNDLEDMLFWAPDNIKNYIKGTIYYNYTT